MDRILNSLYIHSLEAIEKNDIRLLDNNLTLFSKLLNNIAEKSENPDTLKLTESIFNYIDLIAEKMIDENLISNLIKFMETVYQMVNGRLYIAFENLYFTLFNKISEVRSYNQVVKLNIPKLFTFIFSYTKEDIHPYYTKYFYFINQNSNLTKSEKEKLLISLFEEVFNIKYCADGVKRNRSQSVFDTFIYLIKSAIDSRDERIFELYISNLEKKIYFVNDLINIKHVSLIIAIYLYYLAYKEKLVSKADRDKFLEMYKREGVKLGLHLEDLEISDEEKAKMLRLLNKWEWMEELVVKSMIMEGIVNSFLMFLDINKLIKKGTVKDNKDNLFSFLTYCLEDSEPTESVRDDYSVFKKGILASNPREDEIDYHIEALIFNYKKIIEKDYSQLGSPENIEQVRTILEGSINQSLGSLPVVNQNDFREEAYKTSIFTIHNIHSKGIFRDSNFLTNRFNLHIKNSVEIHLIQLLQKEGVAYVETSLEDQNNYNLLASYLDDKIDLLLTGIDSFSLYRYGDGDARQKYQKLLSNEKIKVLTSSYRGWVGLQKENVDFKVNNVSISLRGLNNQEIIHHFLDDNNKKESDEINIMNHIWLKVDKDTAIEWYKNTKIKLEINVEILYRIDNTSKGSIGFVIKFNS